MASVSDIVDKSTQLVSLPDVYFIVRSLLEDNTASLGDVADVLSTDPALTARCLRLVNSAMYSLNSSVDSVSRAVNLLGGSQVHDLVLASSVAGTFAGVPDTDTFNMQRFWQTSMSRAVTAQCLAKRCNVLDAERLFVAGLLSDVGHLILHSQEPELTGQACQHAQETGQSLAEIQQAVIGCDYTEVGSALMREWKLPPVLVDTTEHQLTPQLAPEFPLEASIVHIGALLADTGEPRAADWHDAVHPFAWDTTALEAGVAEDIEAETRERLTGAAELIMPRRRRAS